MKPGMAGNEQGAFEHGEYAWNWAMGNPQLYSVGKCQRKLDDATISKLEEGANWALGRLSKIISIMLHFYPRPLQIYAKFSSSIF
jgi:hypothetical protein